MTTHDAVQQADSVARPDPADGAPREPAGAARRRRRGGFTLLEVAIALAVVVVGLLALFALISSGLDSSAKAVADTYSAAFADAVFNGIRAESQMAAERGLSGTDDNAIVYWRQWWKDFKGGTETFPVPASPMWAEITLPPFIKSPPLIKGNGDIVPIEFKNIPSHHGDFEDIVNHALRYRIEVLKDMSVVGWNTDRENEQIPVILYVWDGRFGGIEPEAAITFYCEFDNPGQI